MIPFSFVMPSSSCSSCGGDAGVRLKAGGGSLGGPGGEGSSSLSSIVFHSGARYAVVIIIIIIIIIISTHWASSVHDLLSSCAQLILSGVVSEVGLWSNVCAVGSVMSSRMLVGLGGRANVFGDAGSYVELEALGL